MLILARRIHEALLTGDDVKVVALSVKGNRVCTGIAAPKDVHIVRGEFVEKEGETD